ncbi:hypothetical protein [Tenacibaculum sp. IB213877]|uniref:hypothetical protein n=1 Tax=Tenacibaculum sp. IB213877 TaxID=3097351 RepID=UPI002A5A34D1|nr:hypothetical protein [Tenacibaculum sp. IB213877]MDY0781287.1 hypothetical protein [Tenacibaculum sp. IB213877]
MFTNKKHIVFLTLLLLPTLVKAQCAMCKAVVEGGNETIAEGVNNGITYLMIFPYILIGILFYFLYRHRKKAKN